MSDFVHLHVHTEYSLLDGVNNIRKLIKHARNLNMRSLAITDHGNLYGIIEFYQQAVNNGIKPIIGQEFYVSPVDLDDKDANRQKTKNQHLVLLARNEKGLRNLYKLSSEGFISGYRYRPRIDKKLIRQYSEGLIALSACRGGEIQKLILENSYEEAEKAAAFYLELFGPEHYYLELMRIGLHDDEKIIKGQLDIADKLGIGCVATNDVHYLTRDDSLVHEVLLCVQTGRNMSDEKRWKFPTKEFYLKSAQEMSELFSDIPQAIENSVKIADMCNVKIDISGKNFKMPRVDIESAFNNENEYLAHLASDGLKRKFGDNPSKEIIKRYEYELSVIQKMNYAGYFIIIHNLIKMAKQHNISIGPGRGSAAGSLILFLLDITQVNPLEYGLFFERFLNPERISMPDVDIDVSDKDRDKLLDLLSEKYNPQNVSLIATFGTLKTRQVFTDVARVFEVEPAEVKRITKKMPENATLNDVVEESEELKKIFNSNPVYKKIFDIALQLENNVRHVSKHAAGVVITPGPMTDYAPVWKPADEKLSITQFEKDALEKIGLVKMDLLGLRTLSVIDNTVEMLESRDIHIDIENLPLDDSKTYELIREAKTAGVFQLESTGMRSFIRRYVPENFDDIIRIISFYRPGPMAGDQMSAIVRKKNNKEPVTYDHPILEGTLKETFGHIIYQEQVMSIANEMSGFSYAKADILRKAMSKKKLDLMNKYEKEFVEGAQSKGIKKNDALHIYEKIAKFAEYGFNKSHGTAYAFLSFRTAYLKAHYPLEFMAATINSYLGTIKKVVKYIEETKAMNIAIKQPDINKSDFKVIPEGDSLRLGMGIIKNVGQNAVMNIIENRKAEPYASFYDFLMRIDTRTVNKKAVESLIKAGAFDSLGIERYILFENLEEIMNMADNEKKKKENGMISLFGEVEADDWQRALKVDNKWEREKLLNYEFEVLEFFISGHPLEKYREIYNSVVSHTIDDFNDLDADVKVIMAGIVNNVQKKKSRRGGHYALFRLFTLEGYISCTIFNETLERYSEYIVKDSSLIITGKTAKDDEKSLPKIIVDRVLPLSDIQSFIYGININLDLENLNEEMIDDFVDFAGGNIGKNTVHFNISEGRNHLTAVSKKFSIALNRQNFKKIEDIFGEGNVHYLFKQF